MNECTKKLNNHAQQIMYYATFYIQLAIVNNLTQVSLRQCLNLDWLESDFNRARCSSELQSSLTQHWTIGYVAQLS